MSTVGDPGDSSDVSEALMEGQKEPSSVSLPKSRLGKASLRLMARASKVSVLGLWLSSLKKLDLAVSQSQGCCVLDL